MNKKDIISQYDIEYNGQIVKVTKLKPKDRKGAPNAARRISSCPSCLSVLKINAQGLWECTGDRLQLWDLEFARFDQLDDQAKALYIKNVSIDSRFLELYDKWVYAKKENKPEEFNCGYTNKIILPIGSGKTRIPDPIVTKRLETSLKRKLTEEEMYGEVDLWIKNRQVSLDYKRGARRVKIPIITLPDDV